MKSNVYSMRVEAREARKRQMIDAGLLSDIFPDVQSIVVTMNYNRGTRSSVLRTLNFYPGSHAYFKISSLSEGYDAGEVDLTNFIHKMIDKHQKSAKGEHARDLKDAPAPSPNVDYEVAITYS